MKKGIFICIVFLFTACDTDVKVKMTEAERSAADSLYLLKKPKVDSILDSLCLSRYDSIYNQLYDSILEERLKTIHKLHVDESNK